MLKNKSPEDINRVGNGGLFTELTPKESAVIEGGSVILFQSLACPFGTCQDPIDILVNGNKIVEGLTRDNQGEKLPGFANFLGSANVEMRCPGECGDNLIATVTVPGAGDQTGSLAGQKDRNIYQISWSTFE